MFRCVGVIEQQVCVFVCAGVLGGCVVRVSVWKSCVKGIRCVIVQVCSAMWICVRQVCNESLDEVMCRNDQRCRCVIGQRCRLIRL